jgi:hypothetical protein
MSKVAAAGFGSGRRGREFFCNWCKRIVTRGRLKAYLTLVLNRFRMKIFTAALLSLMLGSVFACANEAALTEFEKGLRQVHLDYKKGNHEEVTAKLRELLKMMEEEGAEKVGELLPARLGDWQGEALRREDLGILGGGISIARNYVQGRRGVTVKVVKDSPLAKQLLPLMANEDLLRLANRKTHRISGETAVMDGERKMQMVLDGRILLELAANEESGERDLLAVARLLDLRSLSRMK